MVIMCKVLSLNILRPENIETSSQHDTKKMGFVAIVVSEEAETIKRSLFQKLTDAAAFPS